MIAITVPSLIKKRSRSSEETTISTRFRRVLGVSVLTTGLTLGGAFGAAIASADPGDTSPGGGTTNSSDAPGAGSTSPSSGGADGHDATGPSLDQAIRDTIRAFTGGLSPQHRKSAKTSADEAADQAAADDAAESVDSAADQPPAAESSPVAAVTTDPAAAVTDAAPPTAAATPTAQPAADPASGGSSTTKSTPAVATPSTPPGPADSPPKAEPLAAPTFASLLQPTTAALTSATNFVVAVGDTVISLPALLASLPTSATPITDIITYLQASLTSVGGALIPLVSLPGEVAEAVLSLSAHLPDTAATALLSDGPATGSLPGAGLDVPRAPVAPATTVGDPSPRNPITFATRGGFAAPPAATEPAPPVAAPSAPAPESHSNTPLLITGALAALLISASLWALFAAALPGLGGLAAFSATGMRIGYRQAKAGTALYRTDLARFAPRGPIGVVRSDSLVSVHRRRGGTDELPAKRHLRLVDTAA